jgi:diketogulonate reductase-like aldo/keto reductase
VICRASCNSPLTTHASARRGLLSRLKENAGATSIELTQTDLREIKEAIAKVPVQGDRYPEHLEKMTGR